MPKKGLHGRALSDLYFVLQNRPDAMPKLIILEKPLAISMTAQLWLQHGSSTGVTSSFDGFSEPNLIQTAAQIVKKIFKKFHNDLTKKTHQTYYICDDSMNNEKMAEKQTF